MHKHMCAFFALNVLHMYCTMLHAEITQQRSITYIDNKLGHVFPVQYQYFISLYDAFFKIQKRINYIS